MQKYLADTQILIWAIISPSKLPAEVRILLTSNPIAVSQISILEIAIKQKIGKLPELPLDISELYEILSEDGFEVIPLKSDHIAKYGSIPLLANHNDPFDRLLLATAYVESIPIISVDENFKLYKEIIRLVDF